MSFSASRRDSDDSLYDPNYPNPIRASQSRRRSSTSTHSSESGFSDEGGSEGIASAPTTPNRVAAEGTRFPLPRTQTSPSVQDTQTRAAAPSTPTSPPASIQPRNWGVQITPSRTATFRPPGQATPPLRPTPEVDLDSDDDEHLPSFSAPAPAAPLSPARSPTTPRRAAPSPPISPARPPVAARSPMRSSISIPSLRPAYTTSTSTRPLLGGSSDGNSPMSPLNDPFNGEMVQQSTAPAFTRQRSDSIAPPRIHINSIPNSPAVPDASTMSPTAPLAPAFPNPTPAYNPYPQTHESFSDSPGPKIPGRRASLANTHRSGVSISSAITSALGSQSGKLTMAERRNQRKKEVMNKKGKQERAIKGPGGVQINRRPFQSTRLKEEIYKPWLEKKDPAQRWARWITLISILIGLAVMGVICWDGYNSVPRLGNICSVLNEDFSNGIDSSVWTREVRVDGYGHGSFEYTTASNNNSFVDDKVLYLVPTLTSDVLGEAAIQNGYTLNLTQDGTCTSGNVSQCVAISNTSQLTVINPVMSARLTTRMSVNVRYGKVEVVARFPTGDWLWPSISMFPVNETYGKGPRSGEIDIITGRGNNASYTQRGVDYAQSTLHWGPTTDLDRQYLTWGYREQRRSAYNSGFRTFGFEWNENYLWTYIDSRVAQVVSLKFDQSFWNRGKFPSTITNTTTGDVIRLTNPWINSNNNNAPFDQPFYLTLSLGVGGIDGWFPDGEGGKPWLDNSLSAMSDFWNAKNRWWNAWPSDPKVRGFAIKSVKMWKTC